MRQLEEILGRIDGKGYKAYKDLQGKTYSFPSFTLFADHVQGDPFAEPSRFRVRLPAKTSAFPEDTYSTLSRGVALGDFLLRAFAREARKYSKRRGTGKSGLMGVDTPGQEILERSGARINGEYTELRFFVGLPASGRRVLGKGARDMLIEDLPRLVVATLFFKSLDPKDLYSHIETSEDADALRDKLKSLKLVCFVAEGSMLPRRSGVDERPLAGGVPFRPPGSLTVEVELPNRGTVRGMGIPEGVTLIVGGGFHGKSTLLRAIERGVYNHVPGDGRELVVTVATAVKVRAEDGRSVKGVDITPFIGALPGGVDTAFFETPNASGSTSQAANILEALEAGSGLLLLDEDTSATNFMIRDHRMQVLIEKRHEPITPFIDKVHGLYKDYGTSTVLVMGGSGDYFDVADKVVAMVEYEPSDVTSDARDIAGAHPTGRTVEGEAEGLGSLHARGGRGGKGDRIPLPGSLDTRKGQKEMHLKARGLKTIVFGTEEIDLSYVEQLVEDGQVRAIGLAMVYARDRYMDGKRSLSEIITSVEEDVKKEGLDVISKIPYPSDLVRFRGQELASAINRLRSLRVKS